jgi:hypothetical protein
MVKIALDTEECWELMSHVFNAMLEDVEVAKGDRAKIRRWKTTEMRAGNEEMRALTEKMNEDLVRLYEIRRRRPTHRPDWR